MSLPACLARSVVMLVAWGVLASSLGSAVSAQEHDEGTTEPPFQLVNTSISDGRITRTYYSK